MMNLVREVATHRDDLIVAQRDSEGQRGDLAMIEGPAAAE